MAGGAGDGDDAINGINVTPLVDVTLVLLIIFMVTAQMISKQEAVQMNLPKAATGSEVPQQMMLSVVITKDGGIMANNTPLLNDEAIFGIATEMHAKDATTKAQIKADAEVSHGRVIHVLDLIRKAKLDKISFVTQQPGK